MKKAVVTCVVILIAQMLAVSLAITVSRADPDLQTEQWTETRKTLFGTRPIKEDADDVLQLQVPQRPDNGALVPVRITARRPQSVERFVKRIVVVIDRNPEPLAAVFHLTPESGQADLTTHMRIETHSPLRAIAETNDGELFMVAKLVKTSGGCAAPPVQLVAPPDLGRIHVRTQERLIVNEPNWARVTIVHPNHTGFQSDPIKLHPISAHYVTDLEVRVAGRPVLRAELTIASSEDPGFRFHFTPPGPGDIEVQMKDSRGATFTETVPIPRP
jgi:sulfur-oxidizing protein SoxY